jgi:hypothetical protein
MARTWTQEEDDLLRRYIAQFGKQWTAIAGHIPNRSATQVAARWEKCINPALLKGQFTPDEDRLIVKFVEQHGIRVWPKITCVLPHRSPKQCRERWFNNLDPSVTKGPWTADEDAMIFEGYVAHGPRWALIAHQIPGRSDNAIKNRWNASISKRMVVREDGTRALAPSRFRKYTRRNVAEKARPPPLAMDLPKLWKWGEASPVPALSAAPTFEMDQFDFAMGMQFDQSPMLAAGMSVLSPIGFGDDFM